MKGYLDGLFTLEGATAIVTGAAGYFGRSFSTALLSAGAKVVLIGRGEKIKTLADGLGTEFGVDSVDHAMVDFFDEGAYREALGAVVARHGHIDVLVNNAFDFSRETGFNDPSGQLEFMTRDQWMRSLEAGIYWHALSTQVVGARMKEQKRGSIINISSMYGIISPDPDLYRDTAVFNPPSYSTCKAAVLGLTRYTASFLGPFNVRCNAILPGSFPNLEGDSYNSPKDDQFVKRLCEKTVLGRTGRLEDLNGALIYLASEASSYVTGQTLVVDGGWSVR